MLAQIKKVENISDLVRAELDKITNVELKTELAQYIIEPSSEMKKWDYSSSGCSVAEGACLKQSFLLDSDD